MGHFEQCFMVIGSSFLLYVGIMKECFSLFVGNVDVCLFPCSCSFNILFLLLVGDERTLRGSRKQLVT